MKTKFIEATNGPQNWGKFLIGEFTREEWAIRSQIDPAQSLVMGRGWSPSHKLVLDLQTGEGAIFLPGGLAKADLNKHRIWVCPLFEPFLEWLYKQDLSNIDDLPSHVDLPDAEFSLYGYRRPGPQRGKAGGKAGGVARAQALSPDRRTEIARNAAQRRWSKSGVKAGDAEPT